MKPGLWSPERAERYSRLGYWTEDTYAGFLAHHARALGGSPALSDETRSLTWAELKGWTDAVACALARRGLPRDGVLASRLPNWPESYLLRIACEKAGLVWLPIAHSAGPHDMLPLLRKSGACGLVLADDQRGHLGQVKELLPSLPSLRCLLIARGRGRDGAQPLEELALEQPSEDNLARLGARSCQPLEVSMLLPTSGSTGSPKLCEYLLAGTLARGRAQSELFHLTSKDVIAATLPGFGPSITPLLAAPVRGAEVVLLQRPDPVALLRVIEQRRVTIVCAVPALYYDLSRLIREKTADVSSVRLWYSTAMQMPAGLAGDLEEHSQGVVCCGYGAVDLGAWVAASPDDPRDIRWHTVGRPQGGSEIRLVVDQGEPSPEGEIWGRGPSSATGYFRDAEATRVAWTDDGWYRTGDIGQFDAQGNLVILGRKVDAINRGGQKIFPEELENLLAQHPMIAKAAVVPYPDQRLGQRTCACIVPTGADAITLEELTRFLRTLGVATYKLPERLEVLPELPLASGWKVARQMLRAHLEEKQTEADGSREGRR